MVLLIGNYAPDQQQSMQRFSTMMLEGLQAAGIRVELIEPEPLFGRFRGAGEFVTKWLAYIDKLVVFPQRLRRAIRARSTALVHICDHSNAVYVRACKPVPTVVTCHDLLAVRGALGEPTDCPASATGRMLQGRILAGLRQASAVACVSRATFSDAQRLLGQDAAPRISVVTSGLNYPFRKLSHDEIARRLHSVTAIDSSRPFVLHVGSNLRRKNREGVLRIFARSAANWDGQLVFAGDALTPGLRSLGQELGIAARIVEVEHPDGALLEALYNCAMALLFPSRFEGFGWPIAEAQACGCPVICSDNGPMPEVAGDAGLLHAVDDEAGFGADVLRLRNPAERAIWSEKSLRNAERFSAKRMIAEYIELYRRVAPATFAAAAEVNPGRATSLSTYQ
jgi:glycosyltransferase involved in cell wall biosynthesis